MRYRRVRGIPATVRSERRASGHRTGTASPITNDDGDQVTEAITQITWTGDSPDTAIKPGQFQEFPVSPGPLPKTDSITFKALQTYSDGSIVRWIDLSTPGQAEPDHPAPVLKLSTTSADTDVAATSAAATGKTDAAGSGSALALTRTHPTA